MVSGRSVSKGDSSGNALFKHAGLVLNPGRSLFEAGGATPGCCHVHRFSSTAVRGEGSVASRVRTGRSPGRTLVEHAGLLLGSAPYECMQAAPRLAAARSTRSLPQLSVGAAMQ